MLCDEKCQNCNGYLTEMTQDGNLLRDSESNLIRECIECNEKDSSNLLLKSDTINTQGLFLFELPILNVYIILIH